VKLGSSHFGNNIVFKNRMPRRTFGPTKDEVTGGWENCRMRSFILFMKYY
jgi:hypothetical protein